ncbi:thiolase family protein [Rhodococcus sp. IEGM 1305]|uniref:thiolase family protein n=1 Tax=Rhodococcus sp. IEGM 1305 TaxID=3047092 RepID=UPI0024B7B13A|nr:thiolase family protein [Rhodococcus sp. IEGM 1305]MDI9953645.1 thiolase family protein [Rhodococcus sp. IEGM 1305]
MNNAVIVSAVRTPIGTSFKGSLQSVRAEELARTVLVAAIERSGFRPDEIDDVVLAESLYGGGDLARHAAVAAGMVRVPGMALNRHCASGLSAVGVAAASVLAGGADVVVAGGVQSTSTAPELVWRDAVGDEFRGMPPTFPHTAEADDDVTLTVGFNVAEKFAISREAMDIWAVRSHQRAVAAIEAGVFVDELVAVSLPDGGSFQVDEHPRRTTSEAKLASLPPLHPEIGGFSITAGNASGINDGAAALVVTRPEVAAAQGVTVMAEILGWSAVGVDPRWTGTAAIDAAVRVLERTGLAVDDVDLWEVNEAFASVPVAVCRELGLDESRVNVHGSGCSLGHPVAASGTRMTTTLVHELRRRGGGIGVATMCAGGGQGGAVAIRVPAP